VQVLGPADGCPAQFTGCLSLAGAQALGKRLQASQEWETEAWIRCGPLPVVDAGTPQLEPAERAP